ncbi:hypothetical protein ACFOZ5_13425, partial [Marinobacter lacisalsi]
LPGWQLCRGISGSFRVEWVAGFVWNQWQPWPGIRTDYEKMVGAGMMYSAPPGFEEIVDAIRNLESRVNAR